MNNRSAAIVVTATVEEAAKPANRPTERNLLFCTLSKQRRLDDDEKRCACLIVLKCV